MTSERGTARRELSDSEGVDLSYALLMDALESEGNLTTLKGKAQTLFKQFGIELDEEDLKKIEPELKEMLALAKNRGLWGRIELGVSKSSESTGGVLEELGKKMKTRRTPGLSNIAARTYLLVFKGPYDVLVDIVKATLVAVDTAAKKVNVSVFGRHGHLSLSERDVVVAKIARRLNAGAESEVPIDKKSKEAARRLAFTGGAMTHAAKVSKSRERREERGRGIAS